MNVNELFFIVRGGEFLSAFYILEEKEVELQWSVLVQ